MKLILKRAALFVALSVAGFSLAHCKARSPQVQEARSADRAAQRDAQLPREKNVNARVDPNNGSFDNAQAMQTNATPDRPETDQQSQPEDAVRTLRSGEDVPPGQKEGTFEGIGGSGDEGMDAGSMMAPDGGVAKKHHHKKK